MTPAPCAGLVLAAGGGRRLGGVPKALLEWEGRPLVGRAVDTLRAGGCASVHVVVGAGAEAVRALPSRSPALANSLAGVRFVANPAWPTGMGSSLRAGLSALAALDGDVTSVVVTLVDLPDLDPKAVARLISDHQRPAGEQDEGRPRDPGLAIATYQGRRGHPVLIARPQWDPVAALAHDDVGARAFIARHPELVMEVPMDPLPFPYDIDIPADLDRRRGP